MEKQDAAVPEAPRQPSPATLPDPFDLDDVLQQVSKDDQEEWEYEYSTTETETYYLTLELSYPEFKDAAKKTHHHSRGGYYKNWLDQHTGDPNARGTTARPARRAQSDNDDDDDDEPLPEPEADDDDMQPDPEIDVQDRSKDKGKGKAVDNGDNNQIRGKDNDEENSQAPDGKGNRNTDAKREESKEDIQVLELHSRNPIISYRGRVFQGEWAEVLGTEAILANRDDQNPADNPLPALRSLAGNVDVLAASSSRILTTEKILKPQVTEQDSLADIKKEWNINIPTGKDKSGEKAHQTRFLENLMALKKKRGDKDDVTVYAVAGEGKDFKDRKDPDIQPRRRKPPTTTGEADDEASSRPRKRTQRPRTQSGSRRAKRPARIRTSDGRTAGSEVDAPASGHAPLSTPTPKHWEDLMEEGGVDDDDDGDADSDADDSDYNETVDRDGGEDEDVVMDY